jgi:GABA permease
MRYLVVANETLAGGNLLSRLRQLGAGESCRLHVLVPATAPPDHVWTEGETIDVAQRRLDTALDRFRELDAEVDGEVGDARPLQAIADVFERGEAFDGIVLSTLPPNLSRWLKLDLPHRVESTFGLPVIHVVGSREDVSA